MFYFSTNQQKSFKGGFGIIEVVVAAAVAAALVLGMLGIAQFSLRVESSLVRKEQALFLAEEGLEAVRILRDTSFEANIAPLVSGVSYYPVFNTTAGAWSLVSSDPGPIDSVFTRTVILEDVYRDGTSHDIVASTSPGATLDEGTKHAQTRVVWPGEGDGVELETYVADLFGN